MPELLIAEHHDQVYTVWKERQMRGLKVAHVDYHCDMRGIMIDRPNGRAHFVSERETTFIDRGNYLAHAIMEGIVTNLCWVHDKDSGRNFDPGPVVAYESDRKAEAHRAFHAQSSHQDVPLDYAELSFEHWEGLREGEQLDLDWDALAPFQFSPEKQEKMISSFLSKNHKHTPELTFLVYSPGYSNPDRTLYEDFAKELAKKFSATITRLPESPLVTEGQRFSTLRKMIKSALPRTVLNAKRDYEQKLRHQDAANDLAFYQD